MDFGFTIAAYAVAAVLFILSLGGLSGQESAKRAIWYGITGMAIAVVATMIGPGQGLWLLSVVLIAAGAVVGYQLATRVQMTQMPELVAIMHSLVGLAAVFVGFNADLEMSRVAAAFGEAGLAFPRPEEVSTEAAAFAKQFTGFAAIVAKKTAVEINILKVELMLGIWIGAVTFTGSVIAYGKLAGKVDGAAKKLPGGHALNATAAGLSLLFAAMYLGGAGIWTLVLLTLCAFFIGYHLIMGIGGADMPVVVSMLNSYSGWAAAAIGFSLGNDLLIVVGALVGSSGAILSYIMCKAMNRQFVSVILGGFGGTQGPAAEIEGEQIAIDADGVAQALNEADSVIIVPGYGMAVAQAQGAVSELTNKLRAGQERALCHPPGGGASAGAHERAAGGGTRALRHRHGDGRDQRGFPRHGCGDRHRLQRYRQPGGAGRPQQPHRRDAGAGGVEGETGVRLETRAGHGLFRDREPAVFQGKHADVLWRCQDQRLKPAAEDRLKCAARARQGAWPRGRAPFLCGGFVAGVGMGYFCQEEARSLCSIRMCSAISSGFRENGFFAGPARARCGGDQETGPCPPSPTIRCATS